MNNPINPIIDTVWLLIYLAAGAGLLVLILLVAVMIGAWLSRPDR